MSAGAGYDPGHFEKLAAAEGANFWFRARNRLIAWALNAYCPDFRSFLEVGCGTGFALSGIASAFPGAALTGIDFSDRGLKFAMARLPGGHFLQLDARTMPFSAEFDALGAFDMLEHVEEDAQVLGRMAEALKPGGTLLLTVPQHAWLWSPLDDSAHHARRYAAAELDHKVGLAGLKVIRSSSFVSLLLPFMLLSRALARRRGPGHGDGLPELALHPLLNRCFGLAMAFELSLIRLGLSFPWGGSRLVVARKP